MSQQQFDDGEVTHFRCGHQWRFSPERVRIINVGTLEIKDSTTCGWFPTAAAERGVVPPLDSA